MKTYQGSITFDGAKEVRVVEGGTVRLLLRFGQNFQRNYSWGCKNGILAYDILLDAVSEKAADQLLDKFAKQVIAKLNGEESFSLDYYDIKQFADDNMPPDEMEVAV